MSLGRTYRFLSLIAALCIALSSVASAARMAPGPADHADIQAYVLAGGNLADLCSESDLSHEDHDCPFCRLLSDPDDITPVFAIWELIPDLLDLRLADVIPADQRRPVDVFARGPPCPA